MPEQASSVDASFAAPAQLPFPPYLLKLFAVAQEMLLPRTEKS